MGFGLPLPGGCPRRAKKRVASQNVVMRCTLRPATPLSEKSARWQGRSSPFMPAPFFVFSVLAPCPTLSPVLALRTPPTTPTTSATVT